MIVVSILALWLVIGVIGLWFWQAAIHRERTYERFDSWTATAQPADADVVSALSDGPTAYSRKRDLPKQSSIVSELDLAPLGHRRGHRVDGCVDSSLADSVRRGHWCRGFAFT